MTIFDCGKTSVVCTSYSGGGGFKHKAVLCINGYECMSVTCQYYNRTWEKFMYMSVVQKLLAKTSTDILTKRQKTYFMKKHFT